VTDWARIAPAETRTRVLTTSKLTYVIFRKSTYVKEQVSLFPIALYAGLRHLYSQ